MPNDDAAAVQTGGERGRLAIVRAYLEEQAVYVNTLQLCRQVINPRVLEAEWPTKREKHVLHCKFSPLLTLQLHLVAALESCCERPENEQLFGVIFIDSMDRIRDAYGAYFSQFPIVKTLLVRKKDDVVMNSFLSESCGMHADAKDPPSMEYLRVLEQPLNHLHHMATLTRELSLATPRNHADRPTMETAKVVLQEVKDFLQHLLAVRETERTILNSRLDRWHGPNERYGPLIRVCPVLTQRNGDMKKEQRILVYENYMIMLSYYDDASKDGEKRRAQYRLIRRFTYAGMRLESVQDNDMGMNLLRIHYKKFLTLVSFSTASERDETKGIIQCRIEDHAKLPPVTNGEEGYSIFGHRSFQRRIKDLRRDIAHNIASGSSGYVAQELSKPAVDTYAAILSKITTDVESEPSDVTDRDVSSPSPPDARGQECEAPQRPNRAANPPLSLPIAGLQSSTVPNQSTVARKLQGVQGQSALQGTIDEAKHDNEIEQLKRQVEKLTALVAANAEERNRMATRIELLEDQLSRSSSRNT